MSNHHKNGLPMNPNLQQSNSNALELVTRLVNQNPDGNINHNMTPMTPATVTNESIPSYFLPPLDAEEIYQGIPVPDSNNNMSHIIYIPS